MALFSLRVEEFKSLRVEEWKSGRVEEWKSGRVDCLPIFSEGGKRRRIEECIALQRSVKKSSSKNFGSQTIEG